jgi:hypothetical protein
MPRVPREEEYEATGILAKQNHRLLIGDELRLYAFLKLDVRPTEVRYDLHIYLEGRRIGITGEYRQSRPTFRDLGAFKNWLVSMSWPALANSLNVMRTCSEDQGRYVVSVDKELSELMRQLCKQF